MTGTNCFPSKMGRILVDDLWLDSRFDSENLLVRRLVSGDGSSTVCPQKRLAQDARCDADVEAIDATLPSPPAGDTDLEVNLLPQVPSETLSFASQHEDGGMFSEWRFEFSGRQVLCGRIGGR